MNRSFRVPTNAPSVRFEEVQHMRTWWSVILALTPPIMIWWAVVQQLIFGVPWGNNPAPDDVLIVLAAVIGVGLPVALLGMRMTVVVTDVVTITFSPFRFKRRTILPKDISHHQAMQYRPITEYGGWGIKGFSSNRAYNMHGNHGVKLFLSNGNALMIGSQRSEELDTAIAAMLSESR
ncbi:MAG: hypothetical protein E4H30_07770 [Methanomassiliicoccus sp.]|nr:MAG: hypothetical protein E4H30_07770 [Methanomassiliicoccus sp.]